MSKFEVPGVIGAGVKLVGGVSLLEKTRAALDKEVGEIGVSRNGLIGSMVTHCLRDLGYDLQDHPLRRKKEK